MRAEALNPTRKSRNRGAQVGIGISGAAGDSISLSARPLPLLKSRHTVSEPFACQTTLSHVGGNAGDDELIDSERELDKLEDRELMALVREGDFSAFDELYQRHSERVRRFLFTLTWDQDTAEDYLQESFLRLYRARHNSASWRDLRSYLIRIAKNVYLAQDRRKRRCGEVSLSTENRNGYRPFEDIRASERVEPEVRLMEAYRRFKLRQAIGALPVAQRLVFVMSHFEEMRYSEIADVLRVPVGTVKSRMFAAVNTLRRLLRE